jgi:hypothetical protein
MTLLYPCPFCGGTELEISFCGMSFPEVWVRCNTCSTHGPHVPGDILSSADRAKELWNSRN